LISTALAFLFLCFLNFLKFHIKNEVEAKKNQLDLRLNIKLQLLKSTEKWFYTFNRIELSQGIENCRKVMF